MENSSQKPRFRLLDLAPGIIVIFIISIILQFTVKPMPKSHFMFPYITLVDKDLPFFNKADFNENVYSWYALDNHIAQSVIQGTSPFGDITPEQFSQIVRKIGDNMESSPISAQIQKDLIDSGRDPFLVTVTTNAQGFRVKNQETYYPQEHPKKIRIIAAGASITFGINVPHEYTWPNRLEQYLQSANLTDNPIEVINAGAISFDSALGAELIRKKVLPLKPDWVIVSYGYNDYSFNSRDFLINPHKKQDTSKQNAQNYTADLIQEHQSFKGQVKNYLNQYRVLQLVREGLNRIPKKKPSLLNIPLVHIKDYLEKIRGKNNHTVEQYYENIMEIITELKKHNIKPILVNSNIGSPYNSSTLKEISFKTNTPFVDIREIFAKELNLNDDMARNNLQKVLFRVKLSEKQRINQMRVYVLGDFFSLVEIGLKELNDVGMDGDEMADDHIYSGILEVPHGTLLSYRFGKYTPPKDLTPKDPDYWKNELTLEFNDWLVYRRFEVFDHNKITLNNQDFYATPIYRFDDLSDRSDRNFSFSPLMNEICHPNRKGYDLIAQSLAKVFQKEMGENILSQKY